MARTRATTTVVAAALLAAGLLAGGCRGDDEATPRPNGPTTTTDPAWSPPGTPLGAGLEVPEGAHLLGAPLTVPYEYQYDGQPVREPDGLRAFLAVTGDPFVVFDALVAQARDEGFDLPGSAGSCLWSVPVDPGSVSGRIEPVAGPELDEEVTGVRCEAGAATDDTTLEVVLDHDASRPAVVEVRTAAVLPDRDGAPGRHGAAEQTRANRRAELGGTDASRAEEPATFLDADDPVPAGSADLLPDPLDAEPEAEPGNDLLRTEWCRSERDAGDLAVPEGARVLARPVGGAVHPDPGDLALLVVDDAEATLTALYDEAAGEGGADGEGGFFGEPPTEVELQDGASAWRVTFGASAGGDTCSLIASPDGTTVFMTVGRG